MKKIISLLLSAAVACSILSYSLGVSADSPNLLENGSFEDGIGTFTKSGNCILEESEESQDGDGRSALVSAREQNHSSVSFQAADIVQQQGSGEYTFSGWVKLAEADAPNIKLAATYQLSWGNKNETRKWPMGTKTELSYDDWTYLEVKTEIAAEMDGDPISEVKLYFVQDAFDASQAPDLLFDNLSFIKHGEYVEITPAPEVEVPASKAVQSVKGFETTQIGAIRWDAYFETGSSPTAVSDQVAACLSPAKYHWTAPFFAQVASDGKVSFPKETLALWEEEAQYAIDAGIDYFAYLWYDSNDPMSYARKFHTQSELRDTIKMTGILESLNRSAATFEELFAAMKEDYWLYMDGMPVIYVYDANQKDQSFVEQLRKMAAQAGIAEPLYIIGMGYGDAAAAILALIMILMPQAFTARVLLKSAGPMRSCARRIWKDTIRYCRPARLCRWCPALRWDGIRAPALKPAFPGAKIRGVARITCSTAENLPIPAPLRRSVLNCWICLTIPSATGKIRSVIRCFCMLGTSMTKADGFVRRWPVTTRAMSFTMRTVRQNGTPRTLTR